jgi:hypothetical protein
MEIRLLNKCLDAIRENDVVFIKENFNKLNEKHQDNIYYMLCSNGELELVKWILDNKEYSFDEGLNGCTKEEYGFQASCHKEGKLVRNYLLKEKELVLSENMKYWMNENKLNRFVPKKQKF